MYALDTNTVAYFFKGIGRVSERLLTKKPEQIIIPSIVAYEIEFGLLKANGSKQKREQFQSLLSACRICDFSLPESIGAAKVRFQLEKQGAPIGPLDILIAGTAIANNLVLVTHNVREFKKVKGLKVEDWY